MVDRAGTQTAKITLLALLSIAFLFLDNKSQYFKGLHQVADRVALPLRVFAGWPGSVIERFSDYLAEENNLLAQNAALKTTLLAQKIQLQAATSLTVANQHLKSLLALQKSSPLKLTMTTIVSRAGYPYLNLLFVNSKPAVMLNAAVLEGAGIVGQVIAKHDLLDTVLPLVSSKSRVPVQNKQLSVREIAQGNGKNALIIQHVSKSSQVHLGEQFITSGFGGVFPKGYPVGKVVSITPSDNQLFLTLTLQPNVQFNQLNYVAIVNKQGKADA